MAAVQRPRSYAGLFLLLYFLSAGAASRAAADAQTPGEKIGPFIVPIVFLALGTYYAFKNGGRVAKALSSILVGLLVAGFAVGLYRGHREQRASSELASEMRELQAGISLDLSSDMSAAEIARQTSERMDGAAVRLQASDDPLAAEAGRALELLSGLSKEPEERFLAAIAAVDSELLLCVPDMVEHRQFDWRREALEEYAAAARNAQYNCEALPERAKALLVRERFSEPMIQGLLEGMRGKLPLVTTVWREHVSVADAYLAILEHVERNAGAILVHEDGEFEFEDAAAQEEFDGRTERALAAEQRLEAASTRLTESL